MKRWPRVMMMLVVWLLIGAAITVVVAWGAVYECDKVLALAAGRAILVEIASAPPERAEPPPPMWPIAVPKDWLPPAAAESVSYAGWTRVVLSGPVKHQAPFRVACCSSFGWPCRCVRDAWWHEDNGNTTRFDHEGAAIRAPWVKRYLGISFVPLDPVWPGFAVNTLLYAALAWGLWQVPLFLRRRHRRTRNRCTRCGYSLAGLAADAPCPECGGGPR